MKDNTKKLIKELKHRLKFITLNDDDSIFNVDEVKLIVDLLLIYEPEEKFDVEENYNRFLEYVKLYESEEEKI